MQPNVNDKIDVWMHHVAKFVRIGTAKTKYRGRK